MNVRRGPTHAGLRIVGRNSTCRWSAPIVASFMAVRPWCDLCVCRRWREHTGASGLSHFVQHLTNTDIRALTHALERISPTHDRSAPAAFAASRPSARLPFPAVAHVTAESAERVATLVTPRVFRSGS